jgi:hypothetical protein
VYSVSVRRAIRDEDIVGECVGKMKTGIAASEVAFIW